MSHFNNDYNDDYTSKYIEQGGDDDDGDDEEEGFSGQVQAGHKVGDILSEEVSGEQEESEKEKYIEYYKREIEVSRDQQNGQYSVHEYCFKNFLQNGTFSVNLNDMTNNSEFKKALFSTKVCDMKEHLYDNKETLTGKDVLYSLAVWILSVLKPNHYTYSDSPNDSFDHQFNNRKLNSLLQLIHERQNHQSMKLINVSDDLIKVLIKLTEQLNSPNFLLTIFSWLKGSNDKYTPQIHSLIASAYINLNQLEQAEFHVHQTLLLLESDQDFKKNFRDRFVLLAFQCYSDVGQLEELFMDLEKSLKSEIKKKSTNFFEICFHFLMGVKRLGHPQLVRKHLHKLGDNEQDQLTELYEKHLIDLYGLVFYSNRLAYASKILYEPQPNKNYNLDSKEKALSFDIYDVDPKNFLDSLNQVLIKNIANGCTEQKYIMQILQIGQEYPKLQQEAKIFYVSEIIAEMEQMQLNKEQQVQREGQYLTKYVSKWVNSIKESDEVILLHSLYEKNKTIHHYMSLINILKLSGQYSAVIKVIDILYYNILRVYYEEFITLFEGFSLLNYVPQILSNFLVDDSSRIANSEEYKSKYDQLFYIIQEIQTNNYEENTSEKVTMFEKIYTEMDQYEGPFSQDLKNKDVLILCDIFYTKALCLMYTKQFSQAQKLLLDVIAIIIYQEGLLSYTLLPPLSLLSEVSSYLSQKSTSFLASEYQCKILNTLPKSEEEDIERIKEHRSLQQQFNTYQ